jgi:hypothetical protein
MAEQTEGDFWLNSISQDTKSQALMSKWTTLGCVPTGPYICSSIFPACALRIDEMGVFEAQFLMINISPSQSKHRPVCWIAMFMLINLVSGKSPAVPHNAQPQNLIITLSLGPACIEPGPKGWTLPTSSSGPRFVSCSRHPFASLNQCELGCNLSTGPL